MLGGVGPARRGRAGQRWGGRGRGWGRSRGPTGAGGPTGSRGSAPRHRALRGGRAGPTAVCREGESCADPPLGQGRCAGPGQVRAGRGGCGAGRGESRPPPPPCARRAGAAGAAAGSGIGVRGPCGGRGRRGRGGMELSEGPASRSCGCAPAAEKQVRGILT